MNEREEMKTMMTPAERRMLLKRLAESREHLLEDVQSLTPEQRRYRPAPDRWSYAENCRAPHPD